MKGREIYCVTAFWTSLVETVVSADNFNSYIIPEIILLIPDWKMQLGFLFELAVSDCDECCPFRLFSSFSTIMANILIIIKLQY